MGALLSRWRAQPSRSDLLEQIEKEIKCIQDLKKSNQARLKRYVGHLILYSILLYVIVSCIFVFFYFPEEWRYRFLYSVPLLGFPIMVWILRKVLNWFFVRRISASDEKLSELKERKKDILEEVMEKETYKTAKEILEKFDPEKSKTMNKEEELKIHKPLQPLSLSKSGTELRQRLPGGIGTSVPVPYPSSSATTAATPLRNGQQLGLSQRSMSAPGPAGGAALPTYHPQYYRRPPPGPPTPRPIIPRERNTVDRLVEYLVGDGPSQRYALICKACYSHNGMSLKEEFEYLAFRCAYCHVFNPPRKHKPNAPKIEPPTPSTGRSEEEEEEDEEDGVGTGTESGSDFDNEETNISQTQQQQQRSTEQQQQQQHGSDSTASTSADNGQNLNTTATTSVQDQSTEQNEENIKREENGQPADDSTQSGD